MRSVTPTLTALPVRILATLAFLWLAVYAGVALWGGIHRDRDIPEALQHLSAGLLAAGLVIVVGVALCTIWRTRWRTGRNRNIPPAPVE